MCFYNYLKNKYHRLKGKRNFDLEAESLNFLKKANKIGSVKRNNYSIIKIEKDKNFIEQEAQGQVC